MATRPRLPFCLAEVLRVRDGAWEARVEVSGRPVVVNSLLESLKTSCPPCES